MDLKNINGEQGDRCVMCSGLGFCNSIIVGVGGHESGSSGKCKDCDGTGIAQPTRAELLERIAQLESK